jgi:hypothetical protein
MAATQYSSATLPLLLEHRQEGEPDHGIRILRLELECNGELLLRLGLLPGGSEGLGKSNTQGPAFCGSSSTAERRFWIARDVGADRAH